MSFSARRTFDTRLRRISLLLLSWLTVVLLSQAGCGGYGGNGGGGGGGNALAAPTGLVATAGNAQVTLNWTASSGATGYYIKRSITAGTETQIAASTSTSFTDTGLTNGTKYFYVVSAYNSYGQSANSTELSATPMASLTPDVTITIDPTKTKAISPWIYGTNFYSGNTTPQPNFTFDRAGGNRWTAYNWETNASNAGSDYIYNNDNYLSSSNVPAEAVRSFIAGDQAAGLASLFTVQLQGYVSADENGPVDVTQPLATRLAQRFRPVVDKKSAPFTITPPPATTDANVYMDEFAWALDQKFMGMGIFGTSPVHSTFVSLDNEPDLWNSTHLEVQGSTNISSDNFVTKTITLTEALKDQFPSLVIFGPVNYGFEGIYSWQGD